MAWDGHVADPQLLLVDVGVVDPVDAQLAQLLVVGPRIAAVVPEAEGLEEVLVDDVRPGRDDRVDHVVLDHQRHGVLETGREQAAGQGQDDAAVPVGQHPVDDVRGGGKVAGLEGHVAVGPDQGPGVEGGRVDVPDRVLQQFVLFHFHSLSVSRPM
jgi:hypothetical protein